MYKQITLIVDSDISKLALIKQSLTGRDKRSTDHLDKIGDVLNYIHQKYMKGDIYFLTFLLNKPTNSLNLGQPNTLSEILKPFW